jgi:hypothetical protein
MGIDPQTGAEVFKAVVMQEQPPKFNDAAVPNEEFYCSPDARTITEAPLKGRRVRKTVSQLIQAGHDADELEGVGDSNPTDNTLAQARDENRHQDYGKRKGGNRVIWWHEEFAKFDLNGDGVAELLYIQRTDDYKVFGIDEMESEEDHPFEDWSPFPMQHRRIGQSLADKVMDLERINTVLLRQSLNGIYIANNPSTYVHEDSIGENTLDDLLTVRAGRVVRYKGPVEPKERGGNFDPSAGFLMMDRIDKTRQSRTGITQLNQGLDDETLNDTAKGQAQLIARGEQVEEYVARNFGNAFARLITKKARLLQRFGKPITVPIDGEFVEVDPTQWPEDMIARARIGLGASRKEQRIAFRREVIGMQTAAFEAGLDIVDESKFYASAKGFIADAGLGDVDEFFVKPPEDEQGNPLPKPPKPDPEMAKAQAEAQLSQAKLQGEQQAMQAKLEMQQQEAEQKLQLAHAQAAAEADLARAKAEQEAMLAQQKMDLEVHLAERRMQMEERLSVHKASLAQAANDAKLATNRPGGDLSK